MERGENTSNQHLLLFLTMFSFPVSFKDKICPISFYALICRLQMLSIWASKKLCSFVNSLPDKILDWSKFKAFADDKIKLAKIMIFVFDRIEKNCKKQGLFGKGLTLSQTCPDFYVSAIQIF